MSKAASKTMSKTAVGITSRTMGRTGRIASKMEKGKAQAKIKMMGIRKARESSLRMTMAKMTHKMGKVKAQGRMRARPILNLIRRRLPGS